MKVTILVAVAVVAVLLVGVLSLNNYLIAEPHVEITSFNTTGTTSGSSSSVVNVGFVLKLTNNGTGNAKNLTITFSTNTTIESYKQLTYANSTSPYDRIAEFEMGQPYLLGDLKTGETKDFRFCRAVGFGYESSPLTATLKSNEAILDQATVTTPPIPNVKITNFICTGIWHGTKLGVALDLFSLSYTNLGNADAEYLTVTLNTSKTNGKETDTTSNPGYDPNEGFLDEYINGETYVLENLKAGETKTLEKIYFMWGAYKFVEPFSLTVTLKSNNIILDQATIMIPISTTA